MNDKTLVTYLPDCFHSDTPLPYRISDLVRKCIYSCCYLGFLKSLFIEPISFYSFTFTRTRMGII